jgi:hypothetical protein
MDDGSWSRITLGESWLQPLKPNNASLQGQFTTSNITAVEASSAAAASLVPRTKPLWTYVAPGLSNRTLYLEWMTTMPHY